ncbi:MAG TPA: phage portal protein [Thermodesulfobacteriota bacterium]
MWHWVDRLTIGLFPRATLRRLQARAAAEFLLRHYDAAAGTRRTSGWPRVHGDANAVIAPALATVRAHTRDLVRNNRWAQKAYRAIGNKGVGWGITAKPVTPPGLRLPAPTLAEAAARWTAWAETTACDAAGRHTFYGLQKQALRTIAQDGEVLVRRRFRRLEDGLPIPLQLQVLEADHLDTARDGVTAGGNVVVQGVEFDAIGRRVAYWLYPEHPGASFRVVSRVVGTSRRVPATEVLHLYRADRPGQVRGISWFAPCVLTLKDEDEYEDAVLVRQRIAAMLTAFRVSLDGVAQPGSLGPEKTVTRGDGASESADLLEPGTILNLTPGEDIKFVTPPATTDHPTYLTTVLRGIAAGCDVSYEVLTGDYSQVNFSSARMSRLDLQDAVHEWRWDLLIPHLCDPVWGWAMEALELTGAIRGRPMAAWTAPPLPMIEPDKEGLAYKRLIRSGLITWAEAVRERGYDPETLIEEIAAWNRRFDAAGIVLDSDPRKTSDAGLTQARPPGTVVPDPSKVGDGGGQEDADDEDEEAGRGLPNGHARA